MAPAFRRDLLGRLGDPFLRRGASGPSGERPEYEGMGLGLFIAKTLIERTGAEIEFFNHGRPERGGHGALISLTWPASARWVSKPAENLPKENPPIDG